MLNIWKKATVYLSETGKWLQGNEWHANWLGEISSSVNGIYSNAITCILSMPNPQINVLKTRAMASEVCRIEQQGRRSGTVGIYCPMCAIISGLYIICAAIPFLGYCITKLWKWTINCWGRRRIQFTIGCWLCHAHPLHSPASIKMLWDVYGCRARHSLRLRSRNAQGNHKVLSCISHEALIR